MELALILCGFSLALSSFALAIAWFAFAAARGDPSGPAVLPFQRGKIRKLEPTKYDLDDPA